MLRITGRYFNGQEYEFMYKPCDVNRGNLQVLKEDGFINTISVETQTASGKWVVLFDLTEENQHQAVNRIL